MDHTNSRSNGRSHYQVDPQVAGDQLSSHPSHELHNAAYPESDYQLGMGYTPPPRGASSSHANAVGQDYKPYPAPELRHEIPSDSIHDAAYPSSNYRPGGGYSPPVGSPAELPSHGIDNAAYPDSHYSPRAGYSPSAGTSTELASQGRSGVAYPVSHYDPAAAYSRSGEKTQAPASDVIDNAAYPESNYRPGTAYSAGASPSSSPRPSHSRPPLPCPKHLESTSPLSHSSPWTRAGPSSSSDAGPSSAAGLLPQPTGSELPPPPYQPGGESESRGPPSRPLQARQTSNASSPTRRQQEEPIPMTTFPVYQNAIGHVGNRSNASSALERGYKEYDRDQAKVDETNRRRSRRKWLIGTLATTVVVAAIIGVVVALIKNKVFDDDDDD